MLRLLLQGVPGENFQDAGLAPEQRLPVARELGETSLAFLCYPTLTAAKFGKTCEVVREVMGLGAISDALRSTVRLTHSEQC